MAAWEMPLAAASVLKSASHASKPPVPQFANIYYKMSHGGETVAAPWNSGRGLGMQTGEPAVDGGDGLPSVTLDATQQAALTAMSSRLASATTGDPKTGAELGEGAVQADAAPGASRTDGGVK